MTLADGVARTVIGYNFEIPVILQNKSVTINILGIPEHTHSRTLLRVNFIKAANLILDVPTNTYHFGENPNQLYQFEEENDISLSVNHVELAPTDLRDTEAPTLVVDEKKQLNNFLATNKSVFGKSTEPTPYAEHTIVLLDDTPIAVPPYRMSEYKKQLLAVNLTSYLKLE